MARILIVEDMRFISQILSGFFTARGHTVDIAADGEEALEMAPKIMPDLILSDISMPKIDGLEVAKRLKADEATAAIPIMMVTARTDAEAMEAANKVGVDEYMLKPFDAETLMKKAAALLGGFPMNYSLELRGNVPVVTALVSELSGDAVRHLRDAIMAGREAGGDALVLDLSRLERVDAGSVGTVLGLLDAFKKDGLALHLVPPPSAVGLRSFIGQLDGRGTLHADVGAALTALGVDPRVEGQTVRKKPVRARMAVPPAR